MHKLAIGLAAMVVLAASVPDAAGQIYTRRNKDGIFEATNVPSGAGYRLAYPGKGILIHSRGFRGTYSGEYDRHVQEAATVHGVSADLVRAVIQVESEWDRLAVSSKGAQGLMQLMPFTARRFGVSNPFDPRQNVFGGVQYLRFLLDLFQGDVALALAGYNAGENAVRRYNGIPPFKETQNYVRKILDLVQWGFSWAARVAPKGMISFAPSSPPAVASATPTRPAKILPARPRIYYKWRDAAGQLHVGQSPPGDGVPYTMIRALD